MKKRVVSLILILAMLMNLVACTTTNDPGKETAGNSGQTTSSQKDDDQEGDSEKTASTIQFTDDTGRQVELPSVITRIMPTGPISQQILFAIAPDMLVGLADDFSDASRGIIADEYFELDYLGQLYKSADMNIEALALAAPQVILDIGQSMSAGKEDMDSLQQQTGIPTIYIYSDLSNMPEVYRTLGQLLGREERAEELAQFCERIYGRTESIMAQVGDNKVKSMYVLFGDGHNVLARGSYHADLLDWLTDNVAVVDSPSNKGSGNEVDMEQIALWDPEFILFAAEGVYDIVAEDPVWSQMTAIANDNYVEVPSVPHTWMGNPPGVQRYLSLIWLTDLLYPDYCDYDVKAEVVEFYRLFYGCELTDAQYAEITAEAFLK